MGHRKPTIIGLLTAWGVEDWIPYCLEQALNICDEVLVSVGAHAECVGEYEDRTLEIARGYPVTVVPPISRPGSHEKSKSATFNNMLGHSRLLRPGSYIWIFDDDEFYHHSSVNDIVDLLRYGGPDRVDIECKYFYINMSHYLTGRHMRIYKIHDMRGRFSFANRFAGPQNMVARAGGMYHYSLLQNLNLKRDLWFLIGKKRRVDWLDQIYLPFELDNQSRYIQRNYELFGIRSPFCNRGFLPAPDGRLFVHTGSHPEVIPASFQSIRDFRSRA